MKKIILTMFGLLFAGFISTASANVQIGSGIANVAMGEGGNLVSPSETLEVKAVKVLKPDKTMYSKNRMQWNKLNVIVNARFDIAPCFDAKDEVGWQKFRG